jgi:micrococcal nuclease
MTNRTFQISAILLIYAVFLFVFSIDQSFAAQRSSNARVHRVNDGDTVTLTMNGKSFRTRLIGIDAPEMGQRPWGSRAKGHLRSLLKETGGMVFVEMDVTKYDKYDRLLAYLWTPNGDLINEQMVRDGFAVLFTIQPNSTYADRFKKAQQDARSGKRGIWGLDGLKDKPIKYKREHPRR